MGRFDHVNTHLFGGRWLASLRAVRPCFQAEDTPVAVCPVAVGIAFAKAIGHTGGSLQTANHGGHIDPSIGGGPVFSVVGGRCGGSTGRTVGLRGVGGRRPGVINHRWLVWAVHRVGREDLSHSPHEPQVSLSGWLRRSFACRRHRNLSGAHAGVVALPPPQPASAGRRHR